MTSLIGVVVLLLIIIIPMTRGEPPINPVQANSAMLP